MKRKYKILLSMVGVICALMVVNTACRSTHNEWPTVDEMRENLQNEDYTIDEVDKIIIDDNEYIGNAIIATKESEFLAGFWADDVDLAKIIYEHWGAKYQSDHTLRVGTTVYCGTKRAIKDAGINLK